MPDQPNLSVSDTEAQFDRGVLNLVLSEHPWPWHVDEIARELDDGSMPRMPSAAWPPAACCTESGSSCSRRAPPAGPPRSRSAPSDLRAHQVPRRSDRARHWVPTMALVRRGPPRDQLSVQARRAPDDATEVIAASNSLRASRPQRRRVARSPRWRRSCPAQPHRAADPRVGRLR
jgi:hypothetical protein